MTSAIVPLDPPSLTVDGIFTGKAARAMTWRNAAELANWLNGRGGQLVVPGGCAHGDIAASGGTATLHFTIRPRYQALARLWFFQFETDTTATIINGTIAIDGGTAEDFTFNAQAMGESTRYRKTVVTMRQDVSSRSTTTDELSVVITNNSGNALSVSSVSCIEVPRHELELEAATYEGGTDSEGMQSRTAIYSDTTVASDERGVRGTLYSIDNALSVAHKNGIFHWTGSVWIPGHTYTSAAKADLFYLAPRVQQRHLYNGTTTGTVYWNVYGSCSQGGGCTGSVELITSAGTYGPITITGTSDVWGTATTAVVNTEDLTDSVGNRSGWAALDFNAWSTTTEFDGVTIKAISVWTIA